MRDDGTGSRLARAVTARRVADVALVTAGFLVLGLIAALQGVPTFGDPPALQDGRAPAWEQPAPMPSSSPPPDLEPREPNAVLAIVAAVVAGLIIAILAFFVIRAAIRAICQAWRERPLRRAAAVTPTEGGGAVGEPEVHAPTVRSALAVARDAVDAHAVPADAIIAAWVGLEAGAEDAGRRRGRAETPGEFSVRIIGSRWAAEGDVRALLKLYEGVRFGGAAATEQDRDEARRLLASIEAEWR